MATVTTEAAPAGNTVAVRRMLVGVGVVAVVVVLAWTHRWTFDDGFINFRVVKQIEAGHGPVFNAGQRVEVFTSPLWLAVLVVADVLTPIRLEWLSVILGIGFTGAGVAFSIRASRRLWSVANETIEIPAGALAIAVAAPIWYFATSGLEGGLTFAWLGAVLLVTTNWAVGTQRMTRGGWLLIGLGWLVRPELVLFSIAIAAGVVAMERADRGAFRALAASGWAWLLPAVYELFRMGYYASIFPNTAYAKAADLTRWGLGWDYLRQFVDNYALGIAVVCLVVAGYAPLLARGFTCRPRQFALVATWLLGTALVTLYIVRVGGDYVEARLLMPSFFALCAPVAVVRVSSDVKIQSVLRVAAVFTLVVWALVAATTLRPTIRYRTTIDNPSTNVVALDDALDPPLARVYDVASTAPLSFEGRPVDGARDPALPRRTAGLSGIGVVSYALGTNVDVFDIGGLADPPTAHFSLPSRALPGHEKFVPPPWAAARLLAPGTQLSPRTFVNVNFLVRPLIPRTTGAAYEREVTEARHALQCGALRNLQESYEGHLGIGGFLRNIVHSVSYSRITIPPDPALAERKFCR